MYGTPPMAMTNAKLTSSTALEPGPGEVAYNAATGYGLGDRVILGSPTSTVTISNADPAVVSWAAHGQPNGTPVVLTTTGTLPAGLSPNTLYYIINGGTGTFQVALTPTGAPIKTTSAGTGTHTATTQVHRIFESLQAGNTGKYPLLASSATYWKDVGPTNRWAMFDLVRSTATVVPAGTLTVVVTPGQRIDRIGLIGIVADSVNVTITVGASTVFNQTRTLATRNTVGWYSFFFGAFQLKSAVEFINIPPYSNSVVTITFTRASGDISCGGVVMGQSVFLGTTQHDPVDNVENYSTITRDDYGTAILIPKRSVPKTQQKTFCEKGRVGAIRQFRDAANAIPALYSGIDDDTNPYFEPLLILGIYKDFSINLGPAQAEVTLELEEV